MTREKAKEICEMIETHGIEVIKGYGEGKTIQHLNLDGKWVDCDMPISFVNNHSFRIKPEEVDHSCNCKGCRYISLESVDEPCRNCIDSDKYEKEEQTRPFKDCDELIEHYRRKYKSAVGCDIYFPSLYKPCIWVKSKEYGTDFLITVFDNNNESIGANVIINDMGVTMKMLFDNYTFCDGSVCGVIE